MQRTTRPSRPALAHAFRYVQCDIPAGMTIRDYQVLRRAKRKRASAGLLSRLRRSCSRAARRRA